MEIVLNEIQWKVLQELVKSDRPLSTTGLSERTGLDHSKVMGTVVFAREQGWVQVEERERIQLVLSTDPVSTRELAERAFLPLIAERGGVPMQELSGLARERQVPMNEIIRWGFARGWFTKKEGNLVITAVGREAVDRLADDEKALKAAAGRGSVYLDEVPDIDPGQVVDILSKRTSLAKLKSRRVRLVTLTADGRKKLRSDNIQVVREKNLLTSEDITSGEWKDISLRRYDVTLKAEEVFPAKIHLMQKIIQQTRTAFLELGFTEIVSPQVESAFWNFDALFQPQDHPARDMQDTFYLSRPRQNPLPAKSLVKRIKDTHENGGDTGSRGWGYTWQGKKASQMVLRTHTTATTVRALAEDPTPPRKVFCVGKVYRNESISYKHLPEFFQVDGVIIDEAASLATLLGTLREFYRKMGFDQVRFKPAFFPYTEPSAEAFVFMESKKTWIELGGSGVFRPEVTRPLGCRVPVLAWGLGLDRLAMLRYGLKDIRELYWSDLDRLREVPLCR